MPERLYGDQIRLKQVLVNLVKNAIKFSYGKDIRLRVSYDERQEFLKIRVIDQGKGIEQHEMTKLFKYFGKLEAQSLSGSGGGTFTGTENQEGIGLGLAICQQIVHRNGGTISVTSDGLNKGSTFTFTMRMIVVPREVGTTNSDESNPIAAIQEEESKRHQIQVIEEEEKKERGESPPQNRNYEENPEQSFRNLLEPQMPPISNGEDGDDEDVGGYGGGEDKSIDLSIDFENIFVT